jgi:hypothetical protein
MSPTSPRRPLVPEDIDRGRPRDVIFRAAHTSFLAHLRGRQFLPPDEDESDRPVQLLLRAPSNVATIGGAGWAQQLAATAVADVIVGLAPLSAAAELIQRGLRVSFDRFASIIIPGRVVTGTDAGGFVVEGAAIPVRAPAMASVTLQPFKLGVIAVLSNEIAQFSVPNAMQVIEQSLTEAAALRLDAEMFSNTASSSSRPAGLLNGLSTVGAATAGSEAMGQDVGKLLGALASAGGGRDPVFVCSPPQAGALKLRAGAHFDYPVLSSPALAAGTVLAVEAGSFVSGFSAVPRIDTSTASTLHMEDTAPLALVSGTAPTVASPVRSLYQTDASAIRMILRCSWGMRATGHIQLLTGATW